MRFILCARLEAFLPYSKEIPGLLDKLHPQGLKTLLVVISFLALDYVSLYSESFQFLSDGPLCEGRPPDFAL
jgi:hypothetical protein